MADPSDPFCAEAAEPETRNAVEIYQENLDAVSRAFWDRDWAQMLSLMAPGPVSTQDAASELRDRADILPAMMAVRDSFARQRITEYHRICQAAAFEDDCRCAISGTHITHVLRGSAPALKPYINQMRLERRDGVWRCCGLHSDASNRDLLMVPPAQRITP